MKISSLLMFLPLGLLACASTPEAAPATGGEASREMASGPVTYGPALPEGDAVKVADVLAAPDSWAGKDAKVEGQITQVCQKMGCWFELSPGPGSTAHMRVKSPGHDVMIPTNSAGRTAVAYGKIIVREVSEEEAAHYVSEGATAQAGKELSIELVSVELR